MCVLIEHSRYSDLVQTVECVCGKKWKETELIYD